jgi:hypothetical protein
MRIGILGSGLMGGKLGTIFAKAGHGPGRLRIRHGVRRVGVDRRMNREFCLYWPIVDDSTLTWDAFVAGLVDHFVTRHDAELWRVTKPDREIICRVRDIRTRDGFVGLELRMEYNGQVLHTEVHKQRLAFDRRVNESRRLLEAEGWTRTAQRKCGTADHLNGTD